MQDITVLKRDLIESLRRSPRPYAEVHADWKTSCPRLPVWEDVIDDQLIREMPDGLVHPTAAGLAFIGAKEPQG